MPAGRARVSGAQQWRAAVDLMALRVDRATGRATTQAGYDVERATKAYLRIYTHAPGTPTTSPPGGPPAWVTGGLARSVRRSSTIRRRRGVYSTKVGPTALYGRIQELGGRAGRRHATTLPARPYLKPRTRAELATIRRIYINSWREATRT